MSTVLVKKSLELFKDDIIEKSKRKKKPDDLARAIGTKRKGVQKNLRKLQQKKALERESKLKQKKLKNALEEKKRQRKEDQSNENLKMIQQLLYLGNSNSSAVETVLKHAHKPRVETKSKKEEAPRSILFADREFDKKTKEPDPEWD